MQCFLYDRACTTIVIIAQIVVIYDVKNIGITSTNILSDILA